MSWRYFWFDESFIKCYNEEIDERCTLEVDLQYPEKLRKLYKDLSFLPGRMKIGNSKRLLLIYCSHNKFKTSIKSWISFEKRS